MRRVAVSALVGVAVCGAQAFGASPFSSFKISAGGTVNSWFPRVDGSFVVWTDLNHPSAPADNNVYGYNLSTSQSITVVATSGYQSEPVVAGGNVVWTDWTPGDTQSGNLFGKALPAGSSFTVTNALAAQTTPAISGNIVVWQDNRGGNLAIYGMNLTQPGADFAISGTAAYTQAYPDVSGNLVVWASEDDGGDPGNIYGRDLTTGNVFPICNHSAQQQSPRVSGQNVVWTDWRSGKPQIYVKNLVTGIESPLAVSAQDETRAAIDGDLVVWMDDRNGTWDIYGKYLSGGAEFPIADATGLSEENPDVSGNAVVWQQISIPSGTTYTVFGTFVPEPASLAVFVPALLMACRRRRR